MREAIRALRLLILDVDGVLTDGSVYYGDHQETLSRFHIHDGLGIKTLQQKGIDVAVVTARNTKALRRRAKELGVGEVHQAVADKAAVVHEMMARQKVSPQAVAYVGDDLTDLGAFDAVGFPIAVANAVAQVKSRARYVTAKRGGEGAVREVCDLILSVLDTPRAMGVIPARYGSTRFPGKALADICGKPMVWHVYQQAAKSALDQVVVATDDERILKRCRELNCNALLTSKDHPSGTDRVAEVARNADSDYGTFVNIQGDEPLIPPALINELVCALADAPEADLVTAKRRIQDHHELSDAAVVKVVVDRSGNAIYFSREPIPHHRDKQTGAPAYYKHIGIYGYRRSSLLRFAELPPAPLELAESLEQLRALEHGMTIGTVDTGYDSVGVDTPADLERVRQLVQDRGEGP